MIARTDNKTDMRYMIDMAYSADLPINSMGRRIRTRLYFTSESHLHTMLNVLRFGGVDGQKRILSARGLRILNEAPELCYLTHLAIRLFEDTRWDVEDPRRYRVEIMFSPGATATPMHMAELDRDSDTARFDTASLENISREGLTCKDIEDFFSSAIVAGQSDEYHGCSLSPSNIDSPMKPKKPVIGEDQDSSAAVPKVIVAKKERSKEDAEAHSLEGEKALLTSSKKPGELDVLVHELDLFQATTAPVQKDAPGANQVKLAASVEVDCDEAETKDTLNVTSIEKPATTTKSRPLYIVREEDGDGEENEDERVERLARVLARRYFWRAVGVVSFFLGAGCLVFALNVQTQARRRWSTRR